MVRFKFATSAKALAIAAFSAVAFNAGSAHALDNWLSTGWSNSSTTSSAVSNPIFAPSSNAGNYVSNYNAKQGARLISFPKAYAPRQIIVSFADRRLYWITSSGKALAYPVAGPRPQDKWTGTHRISMKRVNPTWTPTAKMRKENPSLPITVPGGHPRNPLGPRALYLGSTLYRIHGTDAPWTIGRDVSKGCIRMYNADAIDLYNRVPTGTRVTVTFKRFA